MRIMSGSEGSSLGDTLNGTALAVRRRNFPLCRTLRKLKRPVKIGVASKKRKVKGHSVRQNLRPDIFPIPALQNNDVVLDSFSSQRTSQKKPRRMNIEPDILTLEGPLSPFGDTNEKQPKMVSNRVIVPFDLELEEDILQKSFLDVVQADFSKRLSKSRSQTVQPKQPKASTKQRKSRSQTRSKSQNVQLNTKCSEQTLNLQNIFGGRNLRPRTVRKEGHVAKQINSGCCEAKGGITSLPPVEVISRTAEQRLNMASFVGEKPYTCTAWRIHTRDKPHTCTVCGVNFNRQGNFKTHKRIHRGEKPYACTVCAVKFNLQGNLNDVRIHTGEKPYTCSVCGMKFSQQGDLTRHTRIHTGEKPYTCAVCGVKFCQQGNLNIHLRIHTGEKPYTCAVCGVKFSQQGNLNTHLRIHTGEKPYACTVCGVKFSRRGHLNKHTRTHTGEKPYMCTVCGMKCIQQGDLDRHMRIHTGEKPYMCTVCGVKFSRQDSLNTHVRIHTGKKA